MRLAIRTSALAGAILSLGLVACGGGDDDDDGGTIDPAGTNHTYVMSQISLPTPTNKYALDLDGDNVADNALGGILGLVGGQGLDLQTPLTTQVADGTLILLANVKAKDLTNASGVGMWLYLGQTTPPPTPAPCTTANPPVCGQHLTGTGMFARAAGGATDEKFTGDIMAGKFTGGPSNVTLQISLGGAPITLPLQQARAEISGITDAGWAAGGKIVGAVSLDDINAHVIPAVKTTVRTAFETACPGTDPASTPPCGCVASGTTLQTLFNTGTPRDCEIADSEMQFVVNIITGAKDIDLNDDGTDDAVSMGLGFAAVKGTFTVP